MILASSRLPARALRRGRRGSALVLVLVMTVALAALALSAIYISSHASLVGKAADREKGYRYAAEAALAMGRSRLVTDRALVLHDSLPTQLLSGERLRGADGVHLPGVLLNLWLARTGSKTGEHGLYASVIAEARDSAGTGARFVRRLELMEENFARYLDWFDRMAISGCYGPGEVYDGPIWSNGNICDMGARFRDSVATAGDVSPASGVYEKGRLTFQPPMALPSLTRLSRLESYARSGNLYVAAPVGGPATGARLRIEFVWWDLNRDLNAVGPEDDPEGFIRVYQGAYANRTRADYRALADDPIKNRQCGDWHWDAGRIKFYPFAVHNTTWFRARMDTRTHADSNRILLGYPWNRTSVTTDVSAHSLAGRDVIMRGTRAAGAKIASDRTPRCFAAGDPHLAPTERVAANGYTTAQIEDGGWTDSFTPLTGASGADGRWLPYPGPAVNWGAFTNPPPLEMRPYLWPIDRGLNATTKGVIYVDGTVALHGLLRGRVTVYATGDVTFVDDLRYAVDPSSADCKDLLGVISAQSITIADNGINTPQNPLLGGDAGDTWMDNNMHFYLDGVVMALNTFVPERWNVGPGNMSTCNGYNIGRGCLYQVGGSIVLNRSVSFMYPSFTGYMESRTYDARMSKESPPYFPTTGRYFDNRFYEVDPQGFDITSYLRRIGQSGS